MNYLKFGHRLTKALEAKKYDEGTLAKKLGITRQAVNKWTTGRSAPGFDTLVSIAKLLDVSLDHLMRGITFTNVPDTTGGNELVTFTSVKVYSKAFYDRVHADLRLEAPVSTYYYQGAFPDNSFLFTMNKENMTTNNPFTSVLKGDILWVDKDLEPVHGNYIFMLTRQQSVEIFQLLMEEDHFIFQSLNNDFLNWPADYTHFHVMYPIRQVIRPPRVLI